MPSPEQPIGDPAFAITEILILLLLPPLAAVHAWAPPDGKVFSLTARVFTGLLAAVTGSVHFVLLTENPAEARLARCSKVCRSFLSFRP